MTGDEKWMNEALKEARAASFEGEVPVGCVIVSDGKIVSRGRNAREKKKNGLLHAEICAIEMACKKLGGWRLHQCEMYVTLEPCPMCCGAIINSRIRKVYIAAKDPKAGAMGSVLDLTSFPFNHKPEIEFGLLEDESKRLLKDFFRELRNKNQRTE